MLIELRRGERFEVETECLLFLGHVFSRDMFSMQQQFRVRLIFCLFFLFTTLAWGGSFLGIHYAIQGFHPYFAAFLRVLTAFVVMAFILFGKGGFRRFQHPLWKKAMLIGVVNMGLAWAFLFWGEKYVSPAIAAIINGTVPLFVVLLSPLLTPNDRLTWGKVFGTAFGFAGVAVIFYPEVNFTGLTQNLKGLLSIVMMAVCYALSVLGNRRLSGKVPHDINLMYQCLAGSVFLLGISYATGEPLILPECDYKAVIAIFYMGIISTVIAMLMFFWMIQKVGSVQATAVTFLVPGVSIVLDMIVLNKWLAFNQAMGCLLILVALSLINFFKAPIAVLRKMEA